MKRRIDRNKTPILDDLRPKFCVFPGRAAWGAAPVTGPDIERGPVRRPAAGRGGDVGRGGHLVQADLLAALDSGQLSRAVLDVTDPEPLPPGHRFWTHPRVFLTPHVASMTQPATAAPVLLENIRRSQRGEPLSDVIDRSQGY